MRAAHVLVIGCGDAGLRIASSLLQRGVVSHLTLADAAPQRIRAEADMMACCYDAAVDLMALDGSDPGAVVALLRAVRPDLIVQSASLISPWAIIGRDDPLARALSAAGIAVQLPAQLPILASVMTAVKDLGLDIPVANLSMPDLTHPILAKRGLAPTIGLGNVSILHLRALAALRARGRAGDRVRIVGHHVHVYGVMQCQAPETPDEAPRVYLGDAGARDLSLAYEGVLVSPGPAYNVIAAAAALPVVSALLPGATPLSFSAPAPQGLPGGYPVRIEKGAVALDLPAGADRDEAIAFNRRMGERDGLERLTDDGEVIFSRRARELLAGVAPELVAPLDTKDLAERTALLLSHVRRIG